MNKTYLLRICLAIVVAVLSILGILGVFYPFKIFDVFVAPQSFRYIEEEDLQQKFDFVEL